MSASWTRGSRLSALGLAVGVALAVSSGVAFAALVTGGEGANSPLVSDAESARRLSTESNTVILANQILNRWQSVAAQAGASSPAWREMYFTQLSLMDLPTLQRIDALKAGVASNPTADYARFTQAFLNAQATKYMVPNEATKIQLKQLASTTTDQVFVPITPCRVVDTRNVGGPIAASTQRAFYFYSVSSVYSWSSQGGAPGFANASCPGTTLTSAGGTLGNVAPSAAVATVTDVGPTAAGNFVVWGGDGTFPQSSAVNFTAGQNLANTTVIPRGSRTGSALDFTVRYNGPSGQADVVVDVVGYFIENGATALECVYLIATGTGTYANGTQPFLSVPTCGAGYTKTGTGCSYNSGSNPGALQESSPSDFSDCIWRNDTGATVNGSNYNAETVCCRVPGQ